jgi:hypothetical protein
MQFEKDLDTSLAEGDLVALFPPVGWRIAPCRKGSGRQQWKAMRSAA